MILSRKKVFQKMAGLQFSSTELGKRAGISLNTVARVKGGKEIRPESAGKIARALNVDVAELMD